MATLDAFFNKIERSVSVSTVEPQKCESSLVNEKNNKDASRKRGRDSNSTAQMRRLQNKRQKSLDSNLNVADHSIIVVDSAAEIMSNCEDCSQVEVEDRRPVRVPSPAFEISYEEFLTGTGIAHIETSLGDSEDADAEIKMSPVKTPLKHTGLTDELPVKNLKTCDRSTDNDECEENLNGSEVASKDIRSFFSKADKVSTQPVSAATLTKIKADVHCQQSEKDSVSSKSKFTEGCARAGSDLARQQRAAIVITDDDLDIEVIDVSQTDDEFLEDNIFDSANSEPNAENLELENAPLMCNELSLDTDNTNKMSSVEHHSVSVTTCTPVEKVVESRRKRSLRTAKLEEASDNMNTSAVEETVLCNQAFSYDHDESPFHKEKYPADIIVVDEKESEIDCDDSTVTGPTDASQLCDVTLAAKLRKPQQVSCFVVLCK